MNTLQINVTGTPAPQGSKRAFVVKNRAVVVDDNKPTLRSWRQDVRAAALEAIYATTWATLDGPITILVTFYLPRPRGHYGTGTNAHRIKPSAPQFPAVKPDIDKLARSTLDALGEAQAWTDDSRVVVLGATKQYADNRPPGAEIQISACTPLITAAASTASLPLASPTGAAAVQEALL